MDDHAADSNRIGGIHYAECAITEHGRPYTVALISLIHGKPGQQHDRNGIWHVALEAPGDIFDGDAARSEGVITDYPVPVTHHKRPRSAAVLVFSGAILQPIIQRRFASVECAEYMVIMKRRRRGQRQGLFFPGGRGLQDFAQTLVRLRRSV